MRLAAKDLIKINEGEAKGRAYGHLHTAYWESWLIRGTVTAESTGSSPV